MDDDCTVYQTVDYIAKRWTLVILLELYKGARSKRYSEIKGSITAITPKILSSRLKELAAHGLIKKTIDSSTIPIKSFYKLTTKGKELVEVIKGIKFWALKWDIKNKLCENTDCLNCTL